MILGSEPAVRGGETYRGARPSPEGTQWAPSSVDRISCPQWAAHARQRASNLVPARTEEQKSNDREAFQSVMAGKLRQEHEHVEEDRAGSLSEELAGEQQRLHGSHAGEMDPNPFLAAREISPGGRPSSSPLDTSIQHPHQYTHRKSLGNMGFAHPACPARVVVANYLFLLFGHIPWQDPGAACG